MEQLEYDYNIHITPGAGDDSLLVRFYIDAVEDHAASKLAGRPMFKDVEHVEIRLPGVRGDGVTRVARPADIARFPRHYQAFKARIGQDGETLVGTPLSVWPWSGMTRSRVEELKYFRIRTVEQLAAMSDGVGQQLMGFQQMKQAAQQYLESVKVTAPIARLQAQLEQAMGKLTEQGLEIARLQARAANLPEPAAVDVMVPMREQIKRELALVAQETPPKPEPPVPQPDPQPVPLQAKKKLSPLGIELAKRKQKQKPKPTPRRSGY